MGKTNLFVYGTLKSGMRSNQLLAAQRFIGPALTEPRYRLYDLGEHPALMRVDAGGIAVQGELWEVDETALAVLDDYEEVPHYFDRGDIALQHVVGPVQAYFFQKQVREGTPWGDRWPRDQ